MRNILTLSVFALILLICCAATTANASNDGILFGVKALVPDVTGMSFSEAEAALATTGLTVGEIAYFYNDYYPEGQVFDQNPYPGEQVDDGTPIDLWVSAGLNPCPEFFDEWGVASMTIGGRALADTIEQLDTGDAMTEFHDYDTWDINEDGVPEKLALELLAHIMCLPDTYVHPVFGPVKPMQDAFYGTFTYVNTVLAKFWEKEDAIIAAAQPMKDFARHILAIGGGLA